MNQEDRLRRVLAEDREAEAKGDLVTTLAFVAGAALIGRRQNKKLQAELEAEERQLQAEYEAQLEAERRAAAAAEAQRLREDAFQHRQWTQDTTDGRRFQSLADRTAEVIAWVDTVDRRWRQSWVEQVRLDFGATGTQVAELAAHGDKELAAEFVEFEAKPEEWKARAASAPEVSWGSVIGSGLGVTAFAFVALLVLGGLVDLFLGPAVPYQLSLAIAVVLGVAFGWLDHGTEQGAVARQLRLKEIGKAWERNARARVRQYGFDPLYQDAVTCKPWLTIGKRNSRKYVSTLRAFRETHRFDITNDDFFTNWSRWLEVEYSIPNDLPDIPRSELQRATGGQS